MHALTIARHSISTVPCVASTCEGPECVGAGSLYMTRRLGHTFIDIWGRRLHHTYVADGTGANVCPSKQHHKLNGLETLDWCSHQTCNGILTEGYHHLPLHISPSPVYPRLQAHVKDPSVLVQEALAWQGDWVTHSSMSASRRVIVQLRKTTQSNYHKKSKINYQELVEILS